MSAKILVVDDEPQFERLILRRLQKHVREGRYDFAFARDGVEALELIREGGDFDMVLADINMPRMDGLTLLGEIKNVNPLLRTVIVSAYGDMKNIRTAMNRGAFDFVVKPIEFSDLEITIEKTLKEVELLQQVEKAKDLAKRNASLEELDRLKTQFFTNISHEIRTPLTIVSGMADQIEGNDRARLLIKRNTENLLQLVNQILELRKLDAGHLKLQLLQANVVKYLEYIIESYHSLAATKSIQLHTLLNEEEIIMDYDAEKMQRILANLLSNAIKFTPDEGHIYLQINKQFREEGQFLQLSVKDTGIGIEEEELAYVFDRFYQAKGQTGSLRTREGQGTGIGLALTKELVELMGGTIRVDSTVGKGSRFEINLPISNEAVLEEKPSFSSAVAEQLSIEVEDGAALSLSESEGPSLLIIEDNPDVAEYLATCLQQDYQLTIATDGQQGIDKALELIPDLIISDVMMPKKDGFEICEFLKNDERSSHIPIVLLTAKADIDSRISGLSRGADAYLTKPFNAEELRVILHNLMELRKRMHQRYAQALPVATADEKEENDYSLEDAFIQKVRRTLEAHLDDSSFGIPQLCRAIQMSRSQLHNKLKALTGLSTSIYIRNLRLKKAKHLLENSELNVSEVAYDVGFKDPNYFSRLFMDAYGFAPSKARK